MKNTKFFLLVLILSLFTVISAGATPWTSAGNAGTVDEADLDEFEADWWKICHKDDKKGTITIYYNVTNPFDFTPVHANWNYLGVTYKDTKNGHPARVTAYLKRVSFTTGATGTIASFDSNDHLNDDNIHHVKTYFNYNFNFNNYAYFIIVYIKRNTTDEDAALYALKLGWDYYVQIE